MEPLAPLLCMLAGNRKVAFGLRALEECLDPFGPRPLEECLDRPRPASWAAALKRFAQGLGHVMIPAGSAVQAFLPSRTTACPSRTTAAGCGAHDRPSSASPVRIVVASPGSGPRDFAFDPAKAAPGFAPACPRASNSQQPSKGARTQFVHHSGSASPVASRSPRPLQESRAAVLGPCDWQFAGLTSRQCVRPYLHTPPLSLRSASPASVPWYLFVNKLH
mmetsp:Transcript_70229/g.132486  ORF Transcript_70229/g.132486 Transcript_70229/m.132486 type:complete len:220 (+) Transcript_70229:838-1497(+)